jgi:methionyl-tRNA synthetase
VGLQRRVNSPGLHIRAHTETAEVPETTDRVACPAVKPEVDPSIFESLDVRVGLITDAKPVQDAEMTAKRGKPTLSRKFLQLTVDIGCEQRTIVSECKYVMDVEDAVGKKVLIVANVPPTEVNGIKSHGVVLTGFNYDPTPMPRSFKVILPGLGRLPPGSQCMRLCLKCYEMKFITTSLRFLSL